MEPSNYLLNAAHYLSLSCTNEIIHEHRTTNGNTTDYNTVVLPVIMLYRLPPVLFTHPVRVHLY